jgi:glutaredoxin
VKEFLSRAGATVTVMNVDEDDRAYDALLARGLRSVPVTIVGDLVIRGYDPAALEQALAAQE